MLIVILIILGLCFGSFVNALVWRIHEKKDWVKARSQCVRCGHQLAAIDLIPVFSWLWLRGRCRYCHKPIDDSPVIELAAVLVFVLSYIYWPQPLHGGQWILFGAWLATAVGLLALLLYDLKWMILPNSILYPTFFIALAGQLAYLVGFEPDKLQAALNWLLSVMVASGIFYLLFIISKGKWIGFGDVRLGLITGTILQTPGKSLLMIFLASVLGTAISLPLVAAGKHKLSAKIPYGPFLIASSFICLLFGTGLINWYKNLFLN